MYVTQPLLRYLLFNYLFTENNCSKCSLIFSSNVVLNLFLGLQEFIEAFSILTFFSEGRLITYDDLTQLLSWSWDSPSLQNGNDQPQPANYKLLVSQSDFVMGLADIPGELVRACGIGARTSDFKMFLFKSCKFLQQFFRSNLLLFKITYSITYFKLEITVL